MMTGQQAELKRASEEQFITCMIEAARRLMDDVAAMPDAGRGDTRLLKDCLEELEDRYDENAGIVAHAYYGPIIAILADLDLEELDMDKVQNARAISYQIYELPTPAEDAQLLAGFHQKSRFSPSPS